jgi:tripartite-type tricarboxylate transporter receptor subunit TctC
MTDLLSGRVQFMNGTSTSVLSHVKAGKLRALATSFDQRSPLMPELPSLVEAGQPTFPIGPWFALVGPAGLSPEIVATMNKQMVAILAKPAVKEQMQKHGFIPRSSTPEQLAAYLKDQLAVWKTALRAAGMEPQ